MPCLLYVADADPYDTGAQKYTLIQSAKFLTLPGPTTVPHFAKQH
jgi:hypothetical protein